MSSWQPCLAAQWNFTGEVSLSLQHVCSAAPCNWSWHYCKERHQGEENNDWKCRGVVGCLFIKRIYWLNYWHCNSIMLPSHMQSFRWLVCLTAALGEYFTGTMSILQTGYWDTKQRAPILFWATLPPWKRRAKICDSNDTAPILSVTEDMWYS